MKLIKISGIVLGLMMADGTVRIANFCMSTVGTIVWTVTNSEGGSHSRAVPFGEIGVSTIRQGIKLKRIKIKWASGSGREPG